MEIKKIKRAQAALEFLTTYGWAFLVIIIMIAALAYFGILSPSKLLPNRCSFGSEFQCVDYQLDATNNIIKFRLKNGVGEAIDVTSIGGFTESVTALACSTITPSIPITAWKSGEIKEMTWSGCNSGANGLVTGEKGKVLVTLFYNKVSSSSAYTQQAKGEIYATVQ